MKFLIINGPNLNLLGRRQPEIYGPQTFEEYLPELRAMFPEHTLEYFQSNVEGGLIDALHAADGDGVVLNGGGYTHTSVALADAVRSIAVPVVEVHLTSLPAREAYRHTSLLAPACRGSVMGFGMDSYRLALLSFMK